MNGEMMAAVLILAAAGTAALLAVARNSSGKATQADATSTQPFTPREILAGAGLLFSALLAIHVADRMQGFQLASIDDFFRLHYSIIWSNQPFFAPHDHLWLTGNFALLGGLISVLGDPMMATLAFSLFSWLIVYTGFCLLSWSLDLPVSVAVVAAILSAAHPISHPLLVSALPDVLSWGLVLTAAGGMIRAWRGSSHPFACLLLANGSVALATTLRFEAWLLAGAVAPLTVLFAATKGKSLPAAWRAGIVALALLPFIFPALWMVSSHRVLGDPIAFVRDRGNPLARHYSWRGEIRVDPNAQVTLGGRARDALLYPRILLVAALPFLLLLAIAPKILGRHRMAILLALILFWLALVSAIAARSGISMNMWPRIVMPSVILTFFAGAAVIATAVRASPAPRLYSHLRWIAVGLLSTGLILHFVQYRRANRFVPHEYMDNSSILMGMRLRYEMDRHPQLIDDLSHDDIIPIWIGHHRGGMGEFAAVKVLSGAPGRFVEQWSEGFPVWLLEEERIRYFLVAEEGGDVLRNHGFVPFIVEGSYTLWKRE